MVKRIRFAVLALAMMPALLQGATVIGDWSGTLSAGPQKLRLVLHITKDEAGRLAATLDSLDQGALGLKFEEVAVSGTSVNLGMPRLAARYVGALSDDGLSLRGTWTQGANETPLSFERQKAEAIDIEAYRKLEGAWMGELQVGQQSLRVVVRVERAGDGYKALLDSPDQGGKDIPVSALTLDGSGVKFEVGAIGGSYTGTLSEDEATITGTWSQGPGNLPLELKKTKEPPEARRPQNPKKPYPYQAVEVEFPGGAVDVTLAEGRTDGEIREQFNTLAPGVLVASGADTATLNLAFEKMTSPWMRFFLAYDPVPAIADLTIPALALWGELDQQVLVDVNVPPVKKALAGGHPASRAEVLPGLNHLFQTCETGDVAEYARIEETMSPVAMARIAAWVQKTTAPR